MSVYVLSDVHGQYEAYLDILDQIGFESFTSEDKLYILGDVIDRGLDVVAILLHIMKYPEKIVLLMGNHELLMYDSFSSDYQLLGDDRSELWFQNGGDTTYSLFSIMPLQVRSNILDFIRDLPYKQELSINNQRFYLVHGKPYDKNALSSGDNEADTEKQKQMLWGAFESYEDKEVTVVFGHRCVAFYDTRFKNEKNIPEHFEIYEKNNYIAIDCGCAYQNELSRLGCIRLDDRKHFYGKLLEVKKKAYW